MKIEVTAGLDIRVYRGPEAVHTLIAAIGQCPSGPILGQSKLQRPWGFLMASWFSFITDEDAVFMHPDLELPQEFHDSFREAIGKALQAAGMSPRQHGEFSREQEGLS